MGEEIFKFINKKFGELNKEDVEEIMKIPCYSRGEHILSTKRMAIIKGGEEGVKKIIEEMAKLGLALDFEDIDHLGWYPIGYRILSLMAAEKIFNLDKKDFTDLGINDANFSFIIKFFFKYFGSKETAFKHVPDYWRKNYTCGSLRPIEFSEKKGEENYFLMRLHDFNFYPDYCFYLKGYFLQVAKLLGGRGASIEESKCFFRGDPFHEFRITWKD